MPAVLHLTAEVPLPLDLLLVRYLRAHRVRLFRLMCPPWRGPSGWFAEPGGTRFNRHDDCLPRHHGHCFLPEARHDWRTQTNN